MLACVFPENETLIVRQREAKGREITAALLCVTVIVLYPDVSVG